MPNSSSSSSAGCGTSGWSSATACAPSRSAATRRAQDVTVQTTLLEARLIAGSRDARARALESPPRRRSTPRRSSRRSCSSSSSATRAPGQRLQPRAQLKESAGRPARSTNDPVGEPGERASAATGARSPCAESSRAEEARRNSAPRATGCRTCASASTIWRAVARTALVFDLPDAAGEASSGSRPRRPSARASIFMQRYYRTAKAVTQLNTIMLQNLGAAIFPAPTRRPEPINDRFQAVRELLDAHDPETCSSASRARFSRCSCCCSSIPSSRASTAPTLRALWRARRRIDGRFRARSGEPRRFIAMLRQPRGLVHALRRMNRYDVLGRYLPAFGRIVGQMQHDLFHVYTVDEHILMVVRNLRRFTMVEFAHEYPLCSRLAANFDRSRAAIRRRQCSTTSPRAAAAIIRSSARIDARRFCRAHGLGRDDTALVELLVEHHLVMSSVAQKQDLSDPDVIREFAATVGDERRLIALYLLTVADIRGTSPKVWNAWKGQAARGPVPVDPPRAARGHRSATTRTSRRSRPRRCASLRALRAVRRGRRGAVAAARRRVLPAPRAAGDRLAHAHLALPCQHRAPGGQGAALADRRRRAGDDLRARPARSLRADLRLLRAHQLHHRRRQDLHDAPRLRARHLPGARHRTSRITTAT